MISPRDNATPNATNIKDAVNLVVRVSSSTTIAPNIAKAGINSWATPATDVRVFGRT